MTKGGPLMFHDLAPFYDATYEAKDYRGDCRALRAIVRRTAGPGAKDWLDVACGTGRHLELLRRDYAVAGVDLSADMLRVARSRLPGVPLTRGDMRTFHLDRPFDVVTCLFSAIAYLRSDRDLVAAFGNFARHLRPGGVAIVEPWIEPRDYKPRHIHLVTHQDPRVTLVRLAISRRRGDLSLIHYHFLLAQPGREARYLHEVDAGRMVPHERLVALMEHAGLRARFLRHGLATGRGLLVGLRPRAG